MKKPTLMVVERGAFASPHSEEQLSLFPIQAMTRIVCLPMAELHGAAILRQLSGARAPVLIDFRSYPFFDLAGLNRSIALDAIHRNARLYLHIPLDLRFPRDQLERWRVREQIGEAFSKLHGMIEGNGATVIALLNNVAEAELLADVARSLRIHGTDAIVEIVRGA